MGFFQDLKEDLSQAVNEMIPEEGEDVIAEEAAIVEEAELEKWMGMDIMQAEDDLAEMEAMLLEKEKEEEQEQAAQEVPAAAQPVKETVRESREKKLDMNAIFSQPRTDEVSIITAGMTINGDINTQGSLELVGSINGNINVSGKMSVTGVIEGNSQASEVYAESAKITGEIRSMGTVKVGQETVIIGNIFASSAVIAGAVKGDIDVQGPVVLDTSAIVMGNIKSKSVQINNGAVIEGMCSQCYADVSPTTFFDEIKKAGR